ncbi:MAG: ABC transporter permease [Bacteroidota bacterium]
MLKNYFLIALRTFQRQPTYALINILGLTIGIAATLLIMLYLTEELSYDQYHEKGDRIFRISSDITEPDDHFRWAVTQVPLARQLKQDYPEVEQYVRFIPGNRTRFDYEDRSFFVEDVYIVDSTVFEVFTFDLLQGNPKTALNAPNSIVLSQSVAHRIFGDEAAMGQSLRADDDRTYKVTGIYRDMPQQSHIIAEAMTSSNTVAGFNDLTAANWGGFWIYSYVLLKEGADTDAFAAHLPEVIKNHVAVIFDQFNINIKYELLPITDIHLSSNFEGEPVPVGNMGFIYIFSVVALFILLIAAINYMNLATARATKRAMEVGIRKVLGSERWQLIGQFLSESILFALFALALSFALVHLLLPFFNSLFELNLAQSLLWSPSTLLISLGIVLGIGFLGGSYPAFYLSAFEPIQVLKGSLAKGSGNPGLRKALVMIQFMITLFMLAGTGVIYDQMNYLRNKDLGFDKEHVLTFHIESDEDLERYPALRQKLLQNPKITNVGTASVTPGDGTGKNLMNIENASGVMEQKGVDGYRVDFDFFNTLGAEIITGRPFDPKFGTDSTAAIYVNESMVERMGWTDPIGKKLQMGTADTLPIHRVIAVVKDFHQQSLYEPIAALIFQPSFNNRVTHIRLNPGNNSELAELIAYVEQSWQTIFPNQPFEYEFVDSAFMENYQSDQIRSRIFSFFSLLMIFIACLGLIGLASFTAEQRTKEIGIRKILGANTSQLIYLLTRNFMLLVALAAIPAFVASWYFMGQWLDTFHYHIRINYWLFALALFFTFALTFLMTGFHALRAAQGNPIDALRFE